MMGMRREMGEGVEKTRSRRKIRRDDAKMIVSYRQRMVKMKEENDAKGMFQF